MTSRAFILAAMVEFRAHEIIVEAGSGESTVFLSGIGVPVWTVDVDRGRFEEAAKLPNVRALCGRQELAFERLNRPVRFAYMDGYDWPYSNMPAGQGLPQERSYQAYGLEWTREASARAHLETMQALHPFIVPDGVVVFDDSWYEHEVLDDDPGLGKWVRKVFHGKGELAAPWLLSRGYAIISAAGPIHETHEGFVALRRTP